MAEPEAWQHMECRLPPRLTAEQKLALQTKMTLADRTEYFALSRCPITPDAEQSMESASHVVTKEHYTDHWERGRYSCARCGHALYASTAKFVGPCLWPSCCTLPHLTTSPIPFLSPHLPALTTLPDTKTHTGFNGIGE